MSTSSMIAVVWASEPGQVEVEVNHGQLASVTGTGLRRAIEVTDAATGHGAFATRVTVRYGTVGFTVFLRDVSAAAPVWIPEFAVAVTAADDSRSYAAIAEAIRAKGLVGTAQRIAAEPEESFEEAAARTRSMHCPIWLGLGRDMRNFWVNTHGNESYWGQIEPVYHCYPHRVPELGDRYLKYFYLVGKGASCNPRIRRWLEERCLPILRSEQREDEVVYDITTFVTLETQPVSAANVRGSDWRAVYPKTSGQMTTEQERQELAPLLEAETHGREQETVCCTRVVARNSGRVARYAWFKALWGQNTIKPAYDEARGFSLLGESPRVFGINRLDGQPMLQQEVAVLVPPGGTVTVDYLVPHQPIALERAERLARLDLPAHLAACRAAWRAKLDAGASVRLPEAAVEERINAGLLHCDLITYGLEPDGPALACTGNYSPIGSESSPIIQFYDSMGHHALAERSLEFFLRRQREDGFIQIFGGYQLETGPVLWSMGEHYRYTRDDAWVDRVKPHILKACEYLLAWRDRNKQDQFRGCGYGLQDGKVADPMDFYHNFMLNALSYVGVARSAEMLATVDPAASARLAAEAKAYREDIRTAYYQALERSPLVPLGDGTWAPMPPPWASYPGALALFGEGGNWFTHGAFGARDSLIGPLYLVIGEVLDPGELGTSFMLRAHQELMTVENVGLSQPYYCRHDYIHLRRGEVKAYLKTFYNGFTGLQDRETYTFWEHYFFASNHKTHEEGWFLMQCRWMLWLEEADALCFLKAIPRRWLADGKRLELRGVRTYFGAVSLTVRSELSRGRIVATVEGAPRLAGELRIRLPHPDASRPREVVGGNYDPAAETVTVKPYRGRAEVELRW